MSKQTHQHERDGGTHPPTMCDRMGSSSARPGSFISAAFAIEAASSARRRLGPNGGVSEEV